MKNNRNKILFSIIAGILLFILQIVIYGQCHANITAPFAYNPATALNKPSGFINNKETYESTVYSLGHPYEALNDFNKPPIHVTHIGKVTTYYALLLNHYTNRYDTIIGNTITELYFKIDKITEYPVDNPTFTGFTGGQIMIFITIMAVVFLLMIFMAVFGKEFFKDCINN